MTETLYIPLPYKTPEPFLFGEHRGYLVYLSPEDMRVAKRASDGSWSNSGKSLQYAYKTDYADGVKATAVIEAKCSEIGVARLFSGIGVNVGYENLGDGGMDLLLPAGSVDVKTKAFRDQADGLDWYQLFIPAEEPRDGYVHSLGADLYVSTLLPTLDSVLVLGYRRRAYIEKLKIVPSRRQGAVWRNREWQATDVEPIDDLLP
jgi:hypothetical protein